MKIPEKKKAYRLWIKGQVKAGRIPEPGGGWVPLNGTTAHQHMKAGHRA